MYTPHDVWYTDTNSDEGKNMKLELENGEKVAVSNTNMYAAVQTLVRSAKRLLGHADGIRMAVECGAYDDDPEALAAARAEFEAIPARAAARINKAIDLNDEHGLGYPVPRGARA